MGNPLVSVFIPNYNYGHYLPTCLDSLLRQTYKNINIFFRDNHSTDNSLEIALSYVDKFHEKGIPFSIAQNETNLGSARNTNLLLASPGRGEYEYILASDDYIAPTFIERCVAVLEAHPSVSMVMTNRIEVDEKGKETRTLPFYNTSCIIPAEEQAAVFMMAGIAIPGQRMGNPRLLRPIVNYHHDHYVAGDWYDNFLYSCCGDIAFIKDDLFYYRVHTSNETSQSEDRLLGSFEHYILINSFIDISKVFGMKKPQKRYKEAIQKLGSMCLRYALKMYKFDKKEIAKQYLSLALVYDESLKDTKQYEQLVALQKLKGMRFTKALQKFEEKNCLTRTVSYDPPTGFIALDC